MVRYHRFAVQRLANLQNKIFINQKRILKPLNEEELNLWDVYPLKTKIPIGDILIEKGETKNISYNDLYRMGFIITSRKPITKYFQFQKVEYKIARINSGHEDYGSTPPGHQIEYDPLNQTIRITGKNAGPLGVGLWVPISSKRMSNRQKLNIYSDYDKIKRRIMGRYMPVMQKKEYSEIKEIPVMISNQGEVVCINHKSTDEPVIAICLGENESIIVDNKNYKIKDLFKNKEEFIGRKTYSVSQQGISKNILLNILQNKPKELLKITTGTGRELIISKDHLLLLNHELTETKAINAKIGDSIPLDLTPKKINPELTDKKDFKLDFDFGWLCGLYLSEGNIYGAQSIFTFSNNKIAANLHKICEEKKWKYTDYRRNPEIIHRTNINVTKEKLHLFLLNNFKTGSAEKEIPNWVYVSPESFRKGLLSGYMDGDGGVSNVEGTGLHLDFCSVSKKLRDGISRLFRQFGVLVYERFKNKEFERQKKLLGLKNGRNSKDAYVGIISVETLEEFKKCCFLRDGRKGEMLKNYKLKDNRTYNLRKKFYNSIKDDFKNIFEISKETGIKYETVNHLVRECKEDLIFKRDKYLSDQEFTQLVEEKQLTIKKQVIIKGKLQSKIYELIKANPKITGEKLNQLLPMHDFRNIYRSIDLLQQKGVIIKKKVMSPKIKNRTSNIECQYIKLKNSVLAEKVYFDKIISIEKYKNTKPVYDLQISNLNNFELSNGLLIHNCGGRGCQLGTTNVWIKTAEGLKLESIDTIRKFKTLPLMVTLNEETLKIETKPLANIITRKPQPIINLEVRGHETVKVTPGHKILVMNEQGELERKEAEKVVVGDIVPICKNLPSLALTQEINLYEGEYIINRSNQYISYNPEKHSYKLKLDRDLGYLTGFWLANGCFGGTRAILFSEKSQEVREKIFKIIEKKKLGNIYKKDEKDFSLANMALENFLKQFGELAGGKHIAPFVFIANEDFRKGLFEGYFNSDGSLLIGNDEKKKLECSFTTKSKDLRDGLVMLLKQFNIIFTLSNRKGPKGKYRHNIYYRANIDASHFKQFMKTFKLVKPNKIAAAKEFQKLITNGREQQSHYDKIPLTNHLKKQHKIKWDKRLKLIGRQAYKRMKIKSLDKFYNSNISYVPIKNISIEQNNLPVYDLQVADNNNYLLENQVLLSNSGKTLLAHSIIDRAYWKGNKRVAVLNDSLNQCTTWCLPCDVLVENGRAKSYDFFSSQLGKIGEQPLPLPCVYLHPNTNTLRELALPGEDVSFKMSMPFDKVIENYDYFLKGKKEWNLGMSATYFRGIKDRIRGCTSIEEVEEVLDDAVRDDLLNKQSKGKILAVVADIFNQKILDVNTDIEPYWGVETNIINSEMNPVLATMEAGLIPIIMTQNLLSKDYFPQFMKYFIDSIFNYQINIGKRKGFATWIFVDEIADVSSTTNKTVAAESLKRIVTEGRNPKLGTMFATQNWSKIDPLIRNNVTHLFAYANKAKEASEITKDFDLADHFKKDILNLDKFEMVAMTHEKFICYNSDGERYETGEPITGYAIMPLSQHEKPGGNN